MGVTALNVVLRGMTIGNRKLIAFIILFSTAFSTYAWEKSIGLGFGNFEAFNIHMRRQTEKKVMEYGYGNDLNMYGQGFYNCIFGSVGKQALKKRINGSYQLYLHFRVLVWNLENKSNIFSAVTLGPKVEISKSLNKWYSISVYGGYTYSSVFRYKRKNYYEVGWPKEWLPDFGVSLKYCFTCK